MFQYSISQNTNDFERDVIYLELIGKKLMFHSSSKFLRSIPFYTFHNRSLLKRWNSLKVGQINLQLDTLQPKDRVLIGAIQQFYQHYQHYAIPYHYIIPSIQSNDRKEIHIDDISWPSELYQFPLGQRTHKLIISVISRGPFHPLYIFSNIFI